MQDLCENCGHFDIYYKEPKDFGANIPKNSNPLHFPHKYRCMLGHRMTLNKDKQVIPFTQNYMCEDFIEK